MEVPQETLDRLSTWFLQSLSLDASLRRAAESSLLSAASTPGFPLALLKLSSLPAADLQIRLASALHFKNLLKTRWPPTSDSPLPDSDKTLIKSLLLPLLLQSPPLIQSQLSEALAIASSHDFPSSWPSLLPDIIASLGNSLAAGDYTAVNSLLAAANSLFLKFRHSFDTQALRLDLKYCLDLFTKPLLETFLNTANLTTPATDPAVLKPLLECQHLCSEIFHSLNSIELPEFFEDHMPEWMDKFKFYLTTFFAPQVETDGTADTLRASICENLQLYMEKNEEEFHSYLGNFATAVYNLLTNTSKSKSSSRDQLAVTAIKFLTTVSTSVHHTLFNANGVLPQICNSVVFPNLRLRDDDEELFENNYVEYIRRDSEGSDSDTLRRTACELLKGLAVNYRDQVTALVSTQIQSMLAAFNANPAQNWKEKDAAIYLVVALSPKPGAAAGGYLVDVESFFTSVIVPELQAQDPNVVPILKAGALKFFTVFREQLPKPAALSLLPGVINFLCSESNVVHSYAATCIEKLLLVKDKAPGASTARYGAADIDPFVPQMLTGLVNALQMPDSQENPYVMKCIMRVLGVANISKEVATTCIQKLVSVLAVVCENPKNPMFNHYLFEAIAAVIRRAGERDASVIPVFEKSLFPELEKILVQDISEFWSYAFQIFTLLIDLHAPPLSDGYMALFQVILDPNSWKRSGSVPALVRLLQAYLRKMPNELNREGRLGQVLGIFSQLISVPSTEELGFFVLNTVVENLSYEIISPYVGNIWGALFGRLQNRRVYKFISPLVIFMSLFLIKYGPGVLVDSINSIQQNLFFMILQQFWIPYSVKISGTIEQKLITVALTRLICESPLMLDPTASENWGKVVDSILHLLTDSDQTVGADLDDDTGDVPETIEYTGSFAKLHNAGKKEDDPLKEIIDPKQFFVSSLAAVSAQFPGRFGTVIQQFVNPANQTALAQLCGTYNSAIV